MLEFLRHLQFIPKKLPAGCAVWLCLSQLLVQGQPQSQPQSAVRIVLESQNVYLGEAFDFQVAVSSDAEPEPPAFPKTADFRVEFLGPHRNQSSSITIVNGRMTRTTVNETIFRFRLTATRTGALRIPPLEVKADGRAYRTQPVPVRVMEPEKLDDMALEIAVSSPECYVGQAVMVTWKWHIGRRVLDYRFNLPLLAEKDFTFPEYTPAINPAQRNAYRPITLPDGTELIALLEQTTRHGVATSCLTFSLPMIPRKPGAYTFPASTVTFAVADPGRAPRNRRQSIFEDFFERTPTRTVTIAAQPQTLVVKTLPEAGRPDRFSGIVGPCRLEVTASPRQVNVGDPIILSVQVSGPEYLDLLRLPPLGESPELASDFRVSGEEPGVVENQRKTFQCTLRAVRAGVKAIPALSIPYFDPIAGTYAEATSTPIPLVVDEVRTVTAQDAQGLPAEPAVGNGSALKTLAEGIAHNYGGEALLADQRAGFATWPETPWKIAFCLSWPGLYLLAAGAASWRGRRSADPSALAAQRAAGKCLAALRQLRPDDRHSPDQTLAAMTDFLAAKLRRPPAAAQSFQDVRKPLAAAGITPPVLERLEKLYADCEASRYAGATPADQKEIPQEAAAIVKLINRVL
ncbi:MAG: BatD family protein [Lentisphaeria bacterium]|nr:BatD family protein [Lentisphaeria bacterium]